MSSIHGFFSLGGLAGAGLGGAIFALGLQDGRGAAGVCLALLVVSVLAGGFLLPTEPIASRAKERRRFALATPAIVGIALLAFFANMIEGGVNDWSALYLTTVRGFDPALAASGFAAFSLAMALCRLASGSVVARLGERAIVAGGGILVAVGIAIVLLPPSNVISPLGFALVALGAANNLPVLIGAAARLPGVTPSSGVTTAATGALLGFLIGPPMLGLIGHAFGLTATLAACAAIGLVVSSGAALYRWPSRPSPPSSSSGT